MDWIYPSLTPQDKATIHTVFIRWAQRNIDEPAYIHPMPVGLLNDPALTNDREQVRWANNNYYNAHMRNLGLMTLALDAADDPGGTLREYLWNATGAYLYILQDMWQTESKGGLLGEGLEYSPQSLAYQTQFLWALHTSGQDDSAIYGPQVVWDQPFWNDVLPAFLHSLSPAILPLTGGESYLHQTFLPAIYGDGMSCYSPDMTAAFAPLGIRATESGNDDLAQAYRWSVRETPVGGEAGMSYRLSGYFLEPILTFMLLDPTATAPVDPRNSSNLGLHLFSEGIGRMLARTDWTEDASLFDFSCGWKGIDHHHACAWIRKHGR